ncbi:GNS1/SUR4 family-domain-containing protein [Pavlovales sp. CCMP2436]|nr:GNS1/SUR4 family-domain-containing protein [Pavlovales sp. CCMP2436]
MLHTLWEWLPTVPEFVAGLTYVDREPFTYHMVTDGWVTEADWALWKHRQVGGSGFFQHPSNIRMNLFAELSEWTGDHWNVPFAVLAGYLAMIVVGPRLMANREALPVHLLVCAWNWGLALFSLCGMVTTWSAIIDLIASKGYEATVCGHPAFMAQSYVGVAMALFIYSKLAELIDTWFLVAKKSNVIFLHWYVKKGIIF